MTTKTMLKMTETTIIPPKMKMAVVDLSAVLMSKSGDGLVLGMVGQVEGCCVTITPV